MADDKEYDKPAPYDEEDTDQLMPSSIPDGLRLLDRPQSQEKWRDLCSQMVLLAKSMNDAELKAFSEVVKRGQNKRGRGAPKKDARQRKIVRSHHWKRENSDGTLNRGLGGPSRAERIAAIAADNNIELDSAGKAYDQALKPHKEASKARAARKLASDKKGK